MGAAFFYFRVVLIEINYILNAEGKFVLLETALKLSPAEAALLQLAAQMPSAGSPFCDFRALASSDDGRNAVRFGEKMSDIGELVANARRSFRFASEARGVKEMRRFAGMGQDYLDMAEQPETEANKHASVWTLP